MSTASDISAFEHSVEPVPAEVLFRDKKWTYIQDSTSNTGQYSGQIQFNLSTISSQASYVNWQEAFIEIPVKLQILNGGASITLANAADLPTVDQLVPKAGAWHWLNSVQVVIDGVTVQTNQIHENVNATFKALTEMDYKEYLKRGPTSSFVLDEWANTPGGAQSLETTDTSTFLNSTIGEYGMANTYYNKGASERSLFTSIDQKSTKLAFDINGGSSNLQSIGSKQVWITPTATAVPTGSPFYVAHYLACIRLADICDYFKKCPMQKNTRGFIYLNYNSSLTTITTNATSGVLSQSKIASVQNNMRYGETCPIMWNMSTRLSASASATGLALPATSTINVTADVDGTTTAGTGLSPSQTFSRLMVPTYLPNPSADHALSQKKTFRYFERITNKFTVAPGQSFTVTITNGIANPKKLFMQPVITNFTATATTSDLTNPLRSPFTSIPATTSAFAALKQLQVTVGNIPIWNSPVNFSYDLYQQEMMNSGVHGGLDDETNAGILSQRDWETLHRFVAVDIGRRLPSEDGASKSIVVSGVSNCNYALTVYYHIWREVVATLDTSMGTVSQGSLQK